MLNQVIKYFIIKIPGSSFLVNDVYDQKTPSGDFFIDMMPGIQHLYIGL